MKTLRYIATALVMGATHTSLNAAAKVVADLAPTQKRQATVDTAERLAQRKAPAPLAGDLTSPFNPPDFDKADPSDPANAARPSPSTAGASTPTAPSAPVAPPTARETLETLAAQITPSGMIQMRGAPRLIIGNKPFEVGTRFTATYNNQDYDLELVAIDRTTFTLRYRSEEITRPIKPVR
jgi:hypothetical protein